MLLFPIQFNIARLGQSSKSGIWDKLLLIISSISIFHISDRLNLGNSSISLQDIKLVETRSSDKTVAIKPGYPKEYQEIFCIHRK